MQSTPDLSYWTVQPNGETFSAKKIRSWVEQHLHGRVLNACAGETRLAHGSEIVRNDICPDREADVHHDVTDLGHELEQSSFSVILYDPPYSEYQARETYSIEAGLPDRKEVAESLNQLLKPGGIIIQWGFSTTPLPLYDGYTTDEVAIWNLLGRQFDWFSSVIRKTPEGHRHRSRLDSSVGVSSNAPAKSSNVCSENSPKKGDGIEISYHQLPRKDSLDQAIQTHLSHLLSGYALDISEKQRSLFHDSFVVSVSESLERETDFTLDERTLSDQFSHGVFDTVVLDLPVSAFQANRRYETGTTGRDTALKQEIDPLVANGGRVIQVGHTATLMPAERKYRRERVAVFAHPEHDRDVIVTVDKRPDPIQNLGSHSKQPTDIDYEATTAEPRYICQRCLGGTYLDPAWYVDCPDCGARHGSYCWENDEVRPVPHEARIHHHSHVHETEGCPVDLDAVDPPFSEPSENTQEQVAISQF